MDNNFIQRGSDQMTIKKYCYEYPRPMLTADIVVFNLRNGLVSVLLIQRGFDPYKGSWALPGGFVEMDENLKDAAMRELREETLIEDIDLYQVMTVGTPDRDPRGRCVTVVYSGIYVGRENPCAGDDAESVLWFSLNNLPSLAFDHKEIIVRTIQKWISVSKDKEYRDDFVRALKFINLRDTELEDLL